MVFYTCGSDFPECLLMAGNLEGSILSKKRSFEDAIDQFLDNPAYEIEGGHSYLPFVKRITFPIYLFLIFLMTWNLLESINVFSSGINQILTALLTGLMVGPILNFDRAVALWVRSRQLKND